MSTYQNPASLYQTGDVVRVGRGSVEWTVTGKGATSGLALRNAAGRRRSAQAFEVALVRQAPALSSPPRQEG